MLDNGLRVLVETIPHVRSVSVGFWIKVGSRNENRRTNGISHLIEHCVFKGTKNRTGYQIVKGLESVGGTINAFTSRELTCYYAHILDEHFEVAVDTLSDIVLNATFKDREVRKEKHVILDEIRDSEDTPDEIIYDHFLRDLFPSHPIGYTILGNAGNVKSFDAKDLRNHYDRFYVPNNMVISVSGNVKADRALKIVESKFGNRKRNGGRKPPGPKPFNPEPLPNPYHVVNKPDLKQTHVFIGFRGMRYDDIDRFGLLGLNHLLGGGMSSRLFRNIREKYGYTYSIYSFTELLRDTGVFGVYAATDKQTHEKVISLIRKDFLKLCEKKIRKTELKMIKSQLKASLLYGLESTSTRMIRAAKSEIYLKKILGADEIIEEIEKITAEKIHELANRFLRVGKEQTSILMSA